MDHATVLIVRSVPSTDSYTVSNAMNAVRVTSSTREVPCLLRPDPVYCLPYRIVPTGYVGLHTHGGKFKGLWEPGRHVTTSPFDQIEYLIPKQAIVWEAPVKSCPTADNVMVEIDVTLVLKLDHSPESIQRFVYNLGPARLNQLLTAIQEEAIRGMARKKLYSEIYDLMDTVVDEQLENTKRSMNEQLGLYGVTVLSLTIINVHLPPHIAKNMEVETTYSSLNRFEQVKQSYNLLVSFIFGSNLVFNFDNLYIASRE